MYGVHFAPALHRCLACPLSVPGSRHAHVILHAYDPAESRWSLCHPDSIYVALPVCLPSPALLLCFALGILLPFPAFSKRRRFGSVCLSELISSPCELSNCRAVRTHVPRYTTDEPAQCSCSEDTRRTRSECDRPLESTTETYEAMSPRTTDTHCCRVILWRRVRRNVVAHNRPRGHIDHWIAQRYLHTSIVRPRLVWHCMCPTRTSNHFDSKQTMCAA